VIEALRKHDIAFHRTFTRASDAYGVLGGVRVTRRVAEFVRREGPGGGRATDLSGSSLYRVRAAGVFLGGRRRRSRCRDRGDGSGRVPCYVDSGSHVG